MRTEPHMSITVMDCNTALGAHEAIGIGGAFSVVRGCRPDRLEMSASTIAGFWLIVVPVILWLAALITVGRRAFGSASR